jgi:hypothetical protein
MCSTCQRYDRPDRGAGHLQPGDTGRMPTDQVILRPQAATSV